MAKDDRKSPFQRAMEDQAYELTRQALSSGEDDPPAAPSEPSGHGQPMHQRDRWIFLILAWTAIPAGIVVAGFVAMTTGAPHWGAAGVSVGLLAMYGATLHVLERKPNIRVLFSLRAPS